MVAPDLRGYGDRAKPQARPDHAGYSKRAMAADQVALMAALGFERFAVVGHDRGARVAHRMALDHPQRVERLALLDVLPTAYVLRVRRPQAVATAYYHWFFFIQPADLPERLIGGDPLYFLHRPLGSWGSGLDAHDPEALRSYERVFADPAARPRDDPRTTAPRRRLDLEHDAASAAAGDRITAPCLVLWGERGVVGATRRARWSVWRTRAAGPGLVTGAVVPGSRALPRGGEPCRHPRGAAGVPR